MTFAISKDRVAICATSIESRRVHTIETVGLTKYYGHRSGPVGALLSMPITVLLVLVLQHNERTVWVAALLTREGSRPPDQPAAPGPDLRRQDESEARAE